jgi:hypothetical protein
MAPNPQLQRSVILHPVRAASAAEPLCARVAHDTSVPPLNCTLGGTGGSLYPLGSGSHAGR